MSTLLPIALLLAAMLSVQAGASIAKTLFPVVGPVGMVALRIALGTIVLCILMRPWRARITSTTWRPLAIYGVTLGVMNLFYYLSLSRVPLGIAVAIEFTGPLAVAVFSSRRPIDFCWIALATGGLLLLLPVVHIGVGIDPLGALYALAFFGVHGRFGRTEFLAGARLDFDENELAAVPDHQVKFAAAGERAVIARYYGAAARAQEAVRQVFADAAVILRIAAPAYAIGGAIE